MINRRKMFGFAAIAPLAAVGISANNAPTQAATQAAPTNKEDAPDGTVMIQLQSQQIRPKEVSFNNGEFVSFSTYQPSGPTLGISVGKDGHMWLKINDELKRVKVE